MARHAPPRSACLRCAADLPALAEPAAPVAICGACRVRPGPLDACLAAVDYAWPWVDCIAQFKYRSQPGMAATLAGLMRAVPGVAGALRQADRVIPMPLAPQRLRERGFNQSHELARRLGAGPCDPLLLLRVRETPPQAGLNRAQRLVNVRGAFALEPEQAGSVRGQRLVLVDDVMTTGATLHAAADELRQAGASHITAVVFARAPAPDTVP